MISAAMALEKAKRMCEANPSREWLHWDEASAKATLREDLPMTCWEVMIGDPRREKWFDYELDDFPTRLFFDAMTGGFYGFQAMRGIVTVDCMGKEIVIP